MLDDQEFISMQDRFRKEDAIREEIIKQSRDVLKAAKKAIYNLHRGDDASGLLEEAERHIEEILPKVKNHPKLRGGAFSAALEEYVEAKAFAQYLKDGSLVTLASMPSVSPEEYLLGLCDFTGELGRHAVHRASERDQDAVKKVRDLIDAIFGQLLQFDFRNSELRRKYDSVKYNLKKVENLVYELSG